MKAVILAGGYGTRIAEETSIRPKPMVEIGGRPILWHIMKIYSAHGINDFVICCGYKGHVIKEYFANYFLHLSDLTIDLCSNQRQVHKNGAEPWKITLVDTGEETMTGGRLKRVSEYLEGETFCFTYGDGVGDVDITSLIGFHRQQGVLATLTAVQPPARFGAFKLEPGKTQIRTFREKPQGDGAYVNGGFFVLEPAVLEYVQDDSTIWERGPLESLAADGRLGAYRHDGFWQPMDTLQDKMSLEALWQSGTPPWRCW